MSAVSSEHVISALREQLSDAHLQLAVLKARLMQMGAAQPSQQPVLVVSDAAEDAYGAGQDGAVQ